MARLWSDENRFATWLEVEIAATEVLVGRGVVPTEALAAIKERARFDVARIEEIEKEVQHDVIAFVSCVAENVGPEGRWLHYGLTSSDVVDTALAILMRDACDLVRADLLDLMAAVQERALRHKHAPMIGRTHGVHAEPMTFGLKMALWHAELQRHLARLDRARATIAVGKLSGAVGTFSHLPPEVEEAVCARLGLLPAPVSSQVLQRDRHAEVMTTLALVAASLEKFATEIRALQKTEVREVEEPFGSGQKGSSAMPHKRNPVGCEQVAGLARLVRDERPRLARERRALARARHLALVGRARDRARQLPRPRPHARPLHAHREGHDRRRGAHAAQPRPRQGARLLGPAAPGADREGDAAGGRLPGGPGARDGGLEERGRLPPARRWPTPRSATVLSEAEIEEVFRLERYLTHVDAVFERVFGSDAAS